MDYEKKYKEAIEMAKVAALNGHQNLMEEIFPELAESGDEKMRQKLIHLVKKSNEYGGYALHKWEADEMLDWLEKQGQKKCIDDLTQQEAMDIAVAKCFEQGEQKKYCGEVNDIAMQQQLQIWFDKGKCSGRDEVIFHPEIYGLQKQGEQTPFYYENMNFQQKDFYPKPQRIISSEAKEAVYNKPAEWKQENVGELSDFENAMMHIGRSFFGENAGLDLNDTDTIKEQAELLLELAPKTEWSEEDEKNSYHLKALLENLTKDNKYEFRIISDNDRDKYTTWLESIKDRVHPQNHWKPSEEQMEALWCAAEKYLESDNANVVELRGKVLESLYNDLKKLKGE